MEMYSKVFPNTDTEINEAIKILDLEYSPIELKTSLNFQVNGTQVLIEGGKDYSDQFFKRLKEVLKEIV
jgi:hypothetical protein